VLEGEGENARFVIPGIAESEQIGKMAELDRRAQAPRPD
jgi:hypothetical protein